MLSCCKYVYRLPALMGCIGNMKTFCDIQIKIIHSRPINNEIFYSYNWRKNRIKFKINQ